MVNITGLNEEWKGIRLRMKNDRKGFDDLWREKNKDHNCDTKDYAENGEWFCEHLTEARNRHFKKEVSRIDEIVCCIISETN